MIQLIGFGNAFGVVDPSPFVAKVDAFLRITGLPYEYKANGNALRKAPKKKLPIIKDNGKVIADSYFIIEYLKETYKPDIDAHLSTEQRAQSHLYTKSLDENLYWCLVYSRWMRDDTWPIIEKTFFGQLPFPLKLFVPKIVRKGVRKNLDGHGIGRHSDTEMLQIFEHSLKSLSQVLGQQDYFFGEKISSFDASAFGLLASFILVNIDNAFNRQAKTYGNLVDYCERIRDKYYSDLKVGLKTAA